MTSRPDRPLDDVKALDEVLQLNTGIGAQRSVSYVPTPPFVLISDESGEANATSSTPLLKVKPSPRLTSVNRYWFNPSWIEESAVPEVDHGEFQTPVWLAVEMTMRSDRTREISGTRDVPHNRRSDDDPRTGQLRSLLSFVSNTTRTAATHRETATSTMGRTVTTTADTHASFHDQKPRHAKSPSKFVHFISSSLKKVSVIHN